MSTLHPKVLTLLGLLFLMLAVDTLLLFQYFLADSANGTVDNASAQDAVGGVQNKSNVVGPAVKLCLVLTLPELNRSTVTESLQRWMRAGSPCLNQSSVVDLILYVKGNPEDRDLISSNGLGNYASCFSNVLVIGAELKPDEHSSNMFFNVYLDERVQRHFAAYTHMFWMEHDVYPLRPGWVDVLLTEASKGGFWMSGSVYLGDGLDKAVQVEQNWNWVGHINGNALYDLRDHAFIEYLKLVVQYEPPNQVESTFDVSIWRVLHAFPYTWKLYQKFRSKFVYSDFIHHWGFRASISDLERSISRTEVFLVHCANFSAGNLLVRPEPIPPDVIWTDRVTKSMRLSVMVRSFRRDLPFCIEAVRSVMRWVQDALEIVVIVPWSDISDFEQQLNLTGGPSIRVVGEAQLMGDQHVQQKYSKLHADKYCKGDLILHLDSDVVFNQELKARDFLWLNKPIIVYQRYETLRAAGFRVLWQNGTSFALGAPVHHEFSRSPLHVYPRSLYPAARQHLERQHKANVSAFLRTRMGLHQDGNVSLLFSDFNYLGAYAWKHAAQHFAMAPLDSDERRALLLPPPIIQAPMCQGNARISHFENMVEVVVQSLRKVWSEGLPCHHVVDVGMMK